MHLNKEFRHPDTGDLFARTDVTGAVVALLPTVPDEIAAQRAMLVGPLPDVSIGAHCFEPRDCPFLKRCWPDGPDHIGNLAGVGTEKDRRPISSAASPRSASCRRRRSSTSRRNASSRRWPRTASSSSRRSRSELEPFAGRLGFLDFETIARAIPVWPGMAPWQQAAAQFSYHERQPDGTYTHAAFLAEGPKDARPPLAEAMVRATANAERVATYTPFERTRIRELQRAVPDLAAELTALEAKLIDLHPGREELRLPPRFQGQLQLEGHPHAPRPRADLQRSRDRGRPASRASRSRGSCLSRTRSRSTSAIACGRTCSTTASATPGRWCKLVERAARSWRA